MEVWDVQNEGIEREATPAVEVELHLFQRAPRYAQALYLIRGWRRSTNNT